MKNNLIVAAGAAVIAGAVTGVAGTIFMAVRKEKDDKKIRERIDELMKKFEEEKATKEETKEEEKETKEEEKESK